MPPRRKTLDTPDPIVLVVDVNPLIRTAVSAYLRECGYQVIEATGALEATIVLQAREGIDVVFIDVDVAGGAAAFELAQRIRKEWPQVKVLLSTGVLRTARQAEGLCEEGPARAKPYDHRELERRIRRLLAR